jgi:hypothetical protein
MVETYEQYVKKKENNVTQNIWRNIKPIHLIGFVILIFVLHKIITSSKSGQNNSWFFILLGIVVVIYIISLYKQSEERGPIPRHIAERIATVDLQREIDADGSYPHGTKVIPTSYFKDQTHDNGDGNGPKLNKYNFGFLVKIPGRSDRQLKYQMNPFTGDCKGIIDVALGWKGEDVKDVQIILPERIIKDVGEKE